MSSKIEWTEETWNPVTGCSKVSDGCTHCYAEKMSYRFGWTDKPWNSAYASENVKLHPDRLDVPFRWKKPRRVFVNSMSDLFHVQVPFEFVRAVWSRMSDSRQHTFQILTKRPRRMLEFFEWMELQSWRVESSLPNVWIGVSVEDQQTADDRIPLLLDVPATVRFLSCEPLLGPLNLDKWFGLEEGNEWSECLCNEIDELDRPCLTCECRKQLGARSGLHWVIAGGESGPSARPMHPSWVRSIRDQCLNAGVSFFFKQWGTWAPFVDDEKFTYGEKETQQNAQRYLNVDGSVGWVWIYDDDGTVENWTGMWTPMSCIMTRVSKDRAGRTLDGRTWDEYPLQEKVVT